MSFERRVIRGWRGAALSVAIATMVTRVSAQDTTAQRLPAVVVTREPARSPLDVPYGISVLIPDSVAPGQTHTQVEQTLGYIPGVTTANRNNPSQDTRISIRGFGARSTFGVRSVRVLRDGIPLTLPDGQTPIDYLDLESVGRVEVIRGAAAALYGNASGGVIDLLTAPPPSGPLQVQGRSWVGTNATQRYAALFGGTSGTSSYSGNLGATMSDGYRAHARQRLGNAFAHSDMSVGGFDVSLMGMGLDMPVAENPGALNRSQLDTAPEMADPAAVTKRARKEVRQLQLGATAQRGIVGDGDFTAQLYGGGRHLYNPLTFAVVGVERRSGGASLRATIPAGGMRTSNLRNWITAGIDAQELNDARKNWTNCNADTTTARGCVGSERGNLQLDQREIVTSVGPYIRDEVEMARLRASFGVRADRTTFELRDAFLSDGRNDSGTRAMSAVSPIGGVALRLGATHSVYANVASAFETPTTTEMVNQPSGTAGLNPDLRPQYSTTIESGVKGALSRRARYDVAVYSTRVRDELIPFNDTAGRTYYRNAGRTRRQGAELGASGDLGPVTLTGAYAYSRFRFVDFSAGGVNQAGHFIPGIPQHQGQAAVTWRTRRAMAVAEMQAKSKVFVNDANAAAAPGYAIANVRIIATPVRSRPWLTPVFGVQNVFDHAYVGSVAVNAAGAVTSAKFYEPAPRRSFLLGLSAATEPW
jgi:iron complex outermembrane recepter protein